MSILLHDGSTFIVQGITGREAVNLTRESLDFGSKTVSYTHLTLPTTPYV